MLIVGGLPLFGKHWSSTAFLHSPVKLAIKKKDFYFVKMWYYAKGNALMRHTARNDRQCHIFWSMPTARKGKQTWKLSPTESIIFYDRTGLSHQRPNKNTATANPRFILAGHVHLETPGLVVGLYSDVRRRHWYWWQRLLFHDKTPDSKFIVCLWCRLLLHESTCNPALEISPPWFKLIGFYMPKRQDRTQNARFYGY